MSLTWTCVRAAAAAALVSGGSAGAEPTPLARLRVTSGAIREVAPGRLRIDGPAVRAVVADRAHGDTARLTFSYLGPSAADAPLASGGYRRQVALKLRARDSCNVLYVAWQLAPRPGVAVLLKRNPGLSSHAECGARGYARVAPRTAAPAPPVAVGTRHALDASLRGRELLVHADGVPAWEGTLPAEALDFDGPVGIRTDNARVELELELDAALAIAGGR